MTRGDWEDALYAPKGERPAVPAAGIDVLVAPEVGRLPDILITTGDVAQVTLPSGVTEAALVGDTWSLRIVTTNPGGVLSISTSPRK